MLQPLVSVIMPVYNREKYIGAAIESILNQTISNFELIIVDDNSTDCSLKKIKSFKDKRIKVFKNEKNLGVASSLNRAISFSVGKYLARQDSDDISMTDRIERQVDFLENNHRIHVCGTLMKSIYKNNLYNYPELDERIKTSMLISYPLASPTLMFRKEVFDNVKFLSGLRTGEDYQWLSSTFEIFNFYNLQYRLVMYREHSNQLSINHYDLQKKNDINIRLKLFKKLGYDSFDYPDEFVKKFLLPDQKITPSEFKIYLKWLKRLSQLNLTKNIFSQKELESTLKKIKADMIFKIYFTNKITGVDNEWRIKSLLYLNLHDSIELISKKTKTYFKAKKKIL